MGRFVFFVLFLQCCVGIVFDGESISQGQEPRRFTLQKQQLPSMTPSEDVMVGGTTESILSQPVAAVVRPHQFSVPGWDVPPHRYLVLHGPANTSHRQKNQVRAPVLEKRPVDPYAYGWFGTKMNRHPHRSFGYQQAYTQWSFE